MWFVHHKFVQIFIRVLIFLTEDIKKNKINDVHRYDTMVRINNNSSGGGGDGREMWVTCGGRNKFKEGLPE